MTKVATSIDVRVPVSTAYNRWTRFEEFPMFMGGVQQVEQLDPQTLRWQAEIAGVRRQWIATILEQVPDRRIAWAATEGATHAGAVTFAPAGPESTTVTLELDYEPEGLVEKAGDAIGLVDRQVTADLERFKQLVESTPRDADGWRGAVTGEPDVGIPTAEDAAASRGDSGKATGPGTALAAGAVLAGAAGVAAVEEASRPAPGTTGEGEGDHLTG